MGMMPRDIRFRDSVAQRALGDYFGHTAAALIDAQSRSRFDGWLYWGSGALLFIADEPIFDGQRAIVWQYEDLGMPSTRFFLYNGELTFNVFSPPLVFHSTRSRIKEIDRTIRNYLRLLEDLQ